MNFVHKSVLLPETINWLLTDPSGIYMDCTLGGAGHSLALARHLTPQGLLVGIDQDEDALAAARTRLQAAPCQVQVVKGNFKELKQILQALQIEQVNGILFDLGVSSYQLDTPERGFSYMQDGPLDMRMNQSGKLTAAQVVNTYSEERLTELIFKYGEERWSKRIAQFFQRFGWKFFNEEFYEEVFGSHKIFEYLSKSCKPSGTAFRFMFKSREAMWVAPW